MDSVKDHYRDLQSLGKSMLAKQTNECISQIESIIRKCSSNMRDTDERKRSHFCDVLACAHENDNTLFIRVLETMGVEDLVDFLYDEHTEPHKIHHLTPDELLIMQRLQKIAPIFPVRKKQILHT